MVKIELTFGQPESGWLPVQVEHNNFKLAFFASNIPENPTDALCQLLILALNGIESEMFWNLEPELYTFRLTPERKEFTLKILKKDDENKPSSPIEQIDGDFDSIILPIYRTLKKFNNSEFEKSDWTKIKNSKIEKLTTLIAEKTVGNNV